MNMIERVARAMAPTAWFPFSPDVHGSPMNRSNAQKAWLSFASTAIQAMRDPTPEMVEAGKRMAGKDAIIVGAWVSMIDAAAIDTGAGEG